ncbi:MAG: gliding motility-associated ABC transporter substrate-binding protein GldG [Cytophagia bacterium]|nr:MAG: gliding motility-associated ABC transporter substrate-binding protein GldG [Cytophagia bacterium]TAG38780.1 MAG: gliding motility-associated ABC transporter substrate-binding protein GldG [Cytophagia bacterium]TAH28099.1 MAG: gliding motility-associated ABC transporter substrate-binding protein GldG [Cytophagales bacterium]
MKQKYFTQFFLGIVLIIIVNSIATQYFFRIDLTEEKRYTITTPTKRILQELDDEVYVKVYLEGDFPSGFRRLQKAIKETLDEFKIYGGKKLKYKFIDPTKVGKNKEEQNKFYRELVQKGIQPSQIFVNEDDKQVQKMIFPAAVLMYKEFELTVSLFKTLDQKLKGSLSPEQILNQSVENTEYNLIAGIRQLTQKDRKRIGFIEGHGELDDSEKSDIVKSLQKYYEVYKVDLPKSEEILNLDAIIVAKPDSEFTDKEKFKIDQFVMKGGKALFFVDVVGVYMDSVLYNKKGSSFTFPYNHNLTDLFFKYGVRINSDLIKDLQASFVELVVGNMGDRPQIKPIPWVYYPIINNFEKHQLTKGLGTIQTKFISTIDTVKAQNVRKTPLLFTSKYSKKIGTPTLVEFNEVQKKPNPRDYNMGTLPVAYLLEGQFQSLYKSRSQSEEKGFVGQSKPTKIIVCTDGDILRNEPKMPLGLDKVYKTIHSNTDFVLNALDYMLDDKGIMGAKNKEVVLRPLDKLKIETESTYWQFLNTILPVICIIIFGMMFTFWRKRKYAK